MLVIKIELHSAITGEVTTLATGKIVNTGAGTPTQGNYRVELRDANGRPWKSGTVEGFPRKRLLAWDLLYRALHNLISDRNVPTHTKTALMRAETNTQPEGVIDEGIHF